MAAKVVRLKRQSLEPSEKSRARQMRTFAVVVVVVVAAFVAGVRWVAAVKDAALSADISNAGLYYRLSMKKPTYVAGEPIDVQLFVTNISSQTIKLEFTTDEEIELTVEHEQDIGIAQIQQPIWELSKDAEHRPKPHPHDILIEPGDSKTFHAVWPQVDFRGNRVPAGRYTITGGLLAKNRTAMLKLHGTTKR